MAAIRCLTCCVALAVAACSGGTQEEPAPIPLAEGIPVGSIATPTLDAVRSKDFLRCGVTADVAGFSTLDAQGEWWGLDVDVCRAIAAAVLGDAKKVRFTPLPAPQRFTALQAGEVDVLSRITTIAFQRDLQLGVDFPVTNWYDGSTFIVRKSSHVKSVSDLDGATVCVQPGTVNEMDVADYLRRHEITFTPVVIEPLEEVSEAYLAGRCDAFSQDEATLAALRARFSDPADHVVLSELISRGPYGPGVMPDDPRWIEIVRWSIHAMVNAEELGLTSTTIDQLRDSDDPEVRRFVGRSNGFGPMLGLDAEWAYRIVKQVGSYAESVERNIKPLAIERDANPRED
jgi:general L-amino acid transport system substrate-binding protein